MKTIKVREAIGDTLDYLVAKCEGRNPLNTLWVWDDLYGNHIEVPYSPSTDWAQGGPIIEYNQIGVYPSESKHGLWVARTLTLPHIYGNTPLVAAMRYYVISKLGEEITISS